ncbi:MAG: hypothetical protein ACKD6N_03555 [Candidatus Bathyarchaeota archaeon]
MSSEVYCYNCQKVINNKKDFIKVEMEDYVRFYCKSCWDALKG